MMSWNTLKRNQILVVGGHIDTQFYITTIGKQLKVCSLHLFWNSRVKLVLSFRVCFGDSLSVDKVNR